MAVYSPVLASSQPAFEQFDGDYNIYFTMPDYGMINDARCICVKIVDAMNNLNMVDSGIYPEGLIYKNFPEDELPMDENGRYWVTINGYDLLHKGWIPNTYYKVQMRLCSRSYPDGADIFDTFVEWKKGCIANNAYSEWSTVMVLKCISTTRIQILKQSNNISSDLFVTDFVQNIEPTVTPTFHGLLISDEEPEDLYKFCLYKGTGEDDLTDDNLIEDSGWLQHQATNLSRQPDTHRFRTSLTDGKSYIVTYSAITVNQFQNSTTFDNREEQQPYCFLVAENLVRTLDKLKLTVDDSSDVARENGCMRIYLNSEEPLVGNYILSRSCELDSVDEFGQPNYAYWEDLKYKSFSDNAPLNNYLFYTDLTIESGVKYKYRIQKENVNGVRTNPLYEYGLPERMVNFEYSYLSGSNGVQLKLNFNHQMSSFKKTVLEGKVDTLGSKYPTVSRNGSAHYAEFPIKALISLHQDQNGLFFKQQKDGYYWSEDRIINADKYAKELDKEGNPISSFNTDLTYDNIFMERKYKIAVLDWLTDGSYKLFRSATEGNYLVTLINVSLAPNATLGRMLCDFSATAYEVGAHTAEDLRTFGIIEVGERKDDLVSSFDDRVIIGQISGIIKGKYDIINESGKDPIFSKNDNYTDLLTLIKNENNYEAGEGLSYRFKKIDSISIEAYPKKDFTTEMHQYEIAKKQALIDEDQKMVDECNAKLAELQALEMLVQAQTANPMLVLNINDTEIVVAPGRKYDLKGFGNISQLYLKYTRPIVFNYICKTEIVEDKEATISAIVSSSLWGQMHGVFTETARIIRNYKNDVKGTVFDTSKEYLDAYSKLLQEKVSALRELKIKNPSWTQAKYEQESLKLSQQYDLRLLDMGIASKSYNFDLYETKNILEPIKELSRKQIEEAYKTEFINYDPETDVWDNGRIYYSFGQITSIDIEADEGTVLCITDLDGVKSEVTIGKTERFKLKNASSVVKSIMFAEPTYAIINYRCSTVQMKMGA